MGKRVLFSIVLIFLIFIMPFVFAAQVDVNKAYDCLNDKIDEKTCDKLSVTEKIFSFLAVGKCDSELRADAKDGECWPEANCNIKTTAQAVLALGTSAAKDWLLEQKGNPSEIIWYLQIEPSTESTCTITYDGDDYSIEIGEDKKIDSAAGNCLSLSSSNYWLEIDSDCYEEEFEISCEENFLTNLLFKSDDSSTIHVSEQTSSATGDGTTREQVNSSCFIDGETCDYEGSLWATLALDSMGEEISSYIPYLIIMAEENNEYFPEVFLYALTGYEDFHYDIISRQTSNGYWSISGDKYYDTALALYPFIYKDFNEKEEAKIWLSNEQEDNGCWNAGNIVDTAFILHSVWTKENPTSPPVGSTCLDAGYYCMSSANCDDAGGNILDNSCSGFNVCCDTQEIQETCDDAGGKICTGGKKCAGNTLEKLDTYLCCFDECEEPEPGPEPGLEDQCESFEGVCEVECGEGYERSYEYTCEYYGDVCCMEEGRPGPSPLLWILIILVILVALGIVFREKLKAFWFRIKSNFKKTPGYVGRGPRPGFPSFPSTERRVTPRRIMPAEHRHMPRLIPRRPAKTSSELDDVLKKLKDMGK